MTTTPFADATFVSPTMRSPTVSPPPGNAFNFSADATLVFVGIRGAGKSTLAIMASSAMKRPVIDAEAVFQRATGTSSAAYKKSHGVEEYHEKQAQVLQEVLRRNLTGSIVVCSWIEKRVQWILRELATTHPVVHVVRDADAIKQHLKVQDSIQMMRLLNASAAVFRSCSSYEFFNVSETLSQYTSQASSRAQHRQLPGPYLTLKQAERHLQQFLSLIYPAGSIPFIDSAFPLAALQPEERLVTYALDVPLLSLESGNMDIGNHISGVDAVQICVDRLLHQEPASDLPGWLFDLTSAITKGVAAVRRSTMLPIIVHVELPGERRSASVERDYLALISHTLRLAPEMLTIDLRLSDSILSGVLVEKRRSRVIGTCNMRSLDAPTWDSPIWRTMYEKAGSAGCDMVRLTRPASCIDDNFAVSHLRASLASSLGPSLPLSAYNTGWLGRNSVCMNSILSVVAMDLQAEDSSRQGGVESAAANCLTADGATRALYGSFIMDAMKLYVLGASVEYSMSPAMHNAGLQACGIPHRYEPHSAASLDGIQHIIKDPFFGGASIGLPFKVQIITLTDSLSRHAQAIGAANTLIPIRKLLPDGSVPNVRDLLRDANRAGPVKALYGENTDWIGIRSCIRRGISPANAVRPATCGVVVGAGGMARAAVYAMLQVGVQNLVIYNRTKKHAETLVNHFAQLLKNQEFQQLGGGSQTRFHIVQSLDEPWPADLRPPTIIISSIPTHRIGDVPAPEFTVPESWLSSKTGGVVIELGYKTLNTPLLMQVRRAASQGWVAMDGLDLLPEQGFAQFELFTGRRAPRRAMIKDLFRSYPEDQGRSNRDELEERLRTIQEQV